ncbi:MAG TPA: Gfo/Idh/MocA family oxidoreductase [Acidimicrobiales bacterium]|nr:Gfo/Idh/MocA family oxidoreductase [Acidimicrobiales bacterium]
MVVGTGFGCLTHVPALRAAGFEVLGLVGLDPDRTARRAERFAIPWALTSLDDALSLPGVSAVTIATPPHSHAPLTLAALAAGKHVLCEKPLARDAAEAATMLSAAESAGLVHLVGAEFRWATGQRLAARAIADGAIGQPRLATFLLHIPLLADPSAEVPSWWSDASQGGGWLGAHATHLIDQVRSSLGEFEAVSAGLVHVSDRDWSGEDAYTLHFRLRSGVDGVLQSSAASWGPMLIHTRIAGTGGTLSIAGDTVRLADRHGDNALEVPADMDSDPPVAPPSDLLVTAYDLLHSTGIDLAPYTALATAFRLRILGLDVADEPALPTFADGMAAMAVLDAARRSAAGSGWEPVTAP